MTRPKKNHPDLPGLARQLRGKSRKFTRAREAVLETLRKHHHPQSVKEIFHELPGGHCDLATVYRVINLLESLGIVKRFHFGEGAARFELVPEGDDGHHHHLVCTNCADVVELEECFPAELEEKIANRSGYSAVTHRLEFFGVCPRCQ